MLDYGSGCEIGRSFLFLKRGGLTSQHALVILLHGATGLADSFLQGETNNFVTLLTSQGFSAIIPSARQTFARGTSGFPRWESESAGKDDSKFFQYLISVLVPSYNQQNSGDTIDKVFILGGSSGAVMASRAALEVEGVAGIVMQNGVSATQARLVNDVLVLDGPISVPNNHPPTLLVSSTIDSILPLANKTAFYNALVAHSIPAQHLIHPSGSHDWNTWTAEYHQTIINWMKSLL